MSVLKKYYTIAEVARLLQVNSSLLRFWERKFPSLQPKKDRSGARKYTQKDMDQLRQIYHLVKEKGYTLQGARAALHKPREGGEEVIRQLQGVRECLVALQDMIQE